MSGNNRIFVFSGNARTFLQCFDSVWENLVDRLFSGDTDSCVHLLFYLKCDDPGPKGQKGWDFTYPKVDVARLECELKNYQIKFNSPFHLRLLPTNEISDHELLGSVGNRARFVGFLGDDAKLLRALHCHWNIERCGQIIEEIERAEGVVFDWYVYVRPDLMFTAPGQDIGRVGSDKVTLGRGSSRYNNDHLAIVPKRFKREFFSARMELIREGGGGMFRTAEEIYWATIEGEFVVRDIGKYFIKR